MLLSYSFEAFFLKLIDVWDDHTDQEVDQCYGAKEHESSQEENGEELADTIIRKMSLNIIVAKLAYKYVVFRKSTDLVYGIYLKPLRKHESH